MQKDDTFVVQAPPPSPSTKSISSETATPKLGSRKSKNNTFATTSPPVDDATTRLYSLKQPTLPHPLPSYRCPLFCCFYAVFDIQVGPKICYQSPPGFMELQIDISVEQIEGLLDRTFDEILQHPGGHDRSKPDASDENDSSIFDACSEYIITGSELTGKIINLSTNHIHVLSRPTMISNERYERNSLLFCVGFVLRRTEDSRPFRPLLNKWALALRDLELECNYLSDPSKRPSIQQQLDRLLVGLNSPSWECNLLLDEANIVNLKLFHPPKVPAAPVHEHAVPIFLRRDRQMHMYDWDLAINWVSLHIDGITTARQISIKAEVDMEMVLSCLRVLRHHGVIALIDMFFFTNRYECCDVAASLLRHDSDFLDAAAKFVCHQHDSNEQRSPSNLSLLSGGRPFSQDDRLRLSSPSSLDRSRRMTGSFPKESHDTTTRGSNYTDDTTSSVNAHPHRRHDDRQREDYTEIKTALLELYLLCTRNISIGDIWIRILTGAPPRTHVAVDWQKMFQTIDHRRFACFGVVHGLLRRIHNFPLLLDPLYFGSKQYAIMQAPDATFEGDLRDRNGRPASRQRTEPDTEQRLISSVAAVMDGRHCDDALVCISDKPLSYLFDMMKDRTLVCTFTASVQ